MKREYFAIRDLIAGGEEAALDRFSLRLSEGDFVELLGTEGSGKTLLRDFLTGRTPVRSGFVRIAGKEYKAGDVLDDLDLQYIGEIPSLAGSLTVAENIALLTRGRRKRILVHRREITERVSFLLAEYGVPVRADRRAEELLPGEQRLVELMRAVENETPFVLIGDILSSTGEKDLELMESVLRKMKQRGCTILVLGSGFPRFMDLIDRIEVIRAGRHARTFYRENFDREAYVKWILGETNPGQVRARALGGTGETGAGAGESGEHAFYSYASIAEDILSGDEAGEKRIRLRIEGLCTGSLKNVTLHALEGEIVGLYNMNNRSNRDLLHCLTGELRAERGSILLNGVPFPGGIGNLVDYLPPHIADCAVVENMGYGENLLLSTMRKNSRFRVFVNRGVRDFLAGEFGQELEAADPAAALGWDLGRYDRIRVALQRILLHRPHLLLAEDILSDMDVRLLQLEALYFGRLTEEGCTILISSANLTALRQIADRIVVLET